MQIRENARGIFLSKDNVPLSCPSVLFFRSGHSSIAHNRPPKSHPSIAKQSSRDLRINSFLSQAAFSLFLSQHSVFLLLSYRNIFSLLSFRACFFYCHSGFIFFLSFRACFFYCHSGLRAGVQVNIDSLAAWIPGQARNDSKKTSPEWQKETKKTRRPSDVFSGEKTRGDGYWVSRDSAHYKQRAFMAPKHQ